MNRRTLVLALLLCGAAPLARAEELTLFHTWSNESEMAALDAVVDKFQADTGNTVAASVPHETVGVVVDGCIRDSAKVVEPGLGVWVKGVTPNYHAQTGIVPFAANVPFDCGGVLVMPGDIIVADDGMVVVAMAPALIEEASKHVEWEEFARERLAQGGDLRTCYPLTEGAQAEYEVRRRGRGARPSRRQRRWSAR